VVIHGQVVTPGGTFEGGLAIDGGKIIAISAGNEFPEAREVIDATGRYVTPGFIDAHTHQGLWYRFGDDVRGQSQMAAQGGVTTFIGIDKSTCMGRFGTQVVESAKDVTPYAEVYQEAREQIDENAYVDMALTLAIMSEGHVGEIERAFEEWGITSFKFFMWLAGNADRWANRLGFPLYGFDEGTMFAGFEAIGQLGRPALAEIHAENRYIERIFRERVMRSGRADLPAVAAVCPPICEIADIRKAAVMAKATGAALYVVHLSAADALPEIDLARQEGVDITVEVNVPWLCVASDEDPPGVYGKFLPPIRDRQNLERLWEGLQAGTIHCMGTDDATVSRRWKETTTQMVAETDRREGRISAYASVVRNPDEPHTVWTLGPASSGLETFVPALMTYGVLAGRVSIERLVEVCCENNAKAFGLYPRKGTLQPGADADINIIDPNYRKRVVPQPLPQDPTDEVFNFLEGRELGGWPRLTMVRGQVVCRDGQVVGKPGHGRLIERKGVPKPYPWWPR
jgi:dihydropyrimidinase/dihydroorotase